MENEQEKPFSNKPPLGSNELIEKAFRELKMALEKTGYKDVVILYSYGYDDKFYLGRECNNYLHAIGVAEQIKNDLLNND